MATKIKACFFDIDGTLVRSDHTISLAVIRAVQRLEQEGVVPVLATGRSYEALLPVKETLGIHSPVICYNGSMIVDGAGETLSHHTLDPAASRDIIALAREKDFHILAYQSGELIYERERPEAKEYFERIGLPGRVVDFDKMDLDFTKSLIIGSHQELIPLREEIMDRFGDRVNSFFSNPRYIEIVTKGIDKGQAVAEVMSILGGTTEEAMAIGDGYNDLPMLNAARWGIIMANALPDLREKFPQERVAPPCDKDGVVTYLTDFFEWSAL